MAGCLRYASYEDLAEIIRYRFTSPKATLHELYGRLVFNILCGNSDDHARNHAGFWDGEHLTLTPAYDICEEAELTEVERNLFGQRIFLNDFIFEDAPESLDAGRLD